jgi:hypothetical protein
MEIIEEHTSHLDQNDEVVGVSAAFPEVMMDRFDLDAAQFKIASDVYYNSSVVRHSYLPVCELEGHYGEAGHINPSLDRSWVSLGIIRHGGAIEIGKRIDVMVKVYDHAGMRTGGAQFKVVPKTKHGDPVGEGLLASVHWTQGNKDGFGYRVIDPTE